MSYDYRLPLMAGVKEVPIPDIQMLVHVPNITEIGMMGDQDYFMAVQYLCLDKEALIEDKTLSATMTNFQVLMKVLEQTQDKDKKSTIATLLRLLFPDYSPAFTKNSIILTGLDMPTLLIDNDNFNIFQESLKKILCVNNLFQGDNVIYNPGNNERAKEIVNKIMKGRRKAAELKSKKGNESPLTRYLSILSVAGIATLQECSQYNLFQLFDLMDRYIQKTESDVDLKVRLAGGKPDKEVESWMKDLHPEI